jgi:hypothetical protein
VVLIPAQVQPGQGWIAGWYDTVARTSNDGRSWNILAWFGTVLDCAPPFGEFDFGLAPGVGP